jgi:DNA-binding protein
MPTLEPTYITENPTILPTVAPTSIMPTTEPSDTYAYITHNPTVAPTVAPTSIMPVISFTTDLTLSNVQTNYLDNLAQQSVIIATANSMNISVDFVTFVSSSVSKDIKIRDIQLLSFNLIATTKTYIPLVGKYSVFTSDPMSLFTALSNTMTSAVSNGVFTNYLVAVSLQLNSTATASASVSGITIVQINTTTTIISPTSTPTTASPTSSPTILNQYDVTSPYSQTNYYYILLYIFGSFVSFWLLVYIVIVFYKRKRRRLAKYIMNLPSTVRQLGSHSIIEQSIEGSIEQPNTIQNNSNNNIKNIEDIVLIIDNK